jgi:hypothetical protein
MHIRILTADSKVEKFEFQLPRYKGGILVLREIYLGKLQENHRNSALQLRINRKENPIQISQMGRVVA